MRELEQLQVQAKETVLLSEAKLQAAQEYGGDQDYYTHSHRDDKNGWDQAGAVQLWWVELAQRLKQEEQQHHQQGRESSKSNHVRFAALPDEHDHYRSEDGRSNDGSTLGTRLVEAKERESQLSAAVKEQGLEVVFLRQVFEKNYFVLIFNDSNLYQ